MREKRRPEFDFWTLSFSEDENTKVKSLGRKGREWNRGVQWRFVGRYMGSPQVRPQSQDAEVKVCK